VPLTQEASTLMITYGNIADVVADRLRDMILLGQLQPGQWIRQSEVAGQLGVSIMPVREALRQLQAEGLVAFHPRRGAMVADASLSAFLELDRISEELERLACQWVAEDFSRIPLDKMHEVLVQLEAAEIQGDMPRRLRLVRQFRYLIYEAAQKPILLNLQSNLFHMGAPYRRLFSFVDEVAPQRMEAYRNIYRACAARDLDALLTSMAELYELARQAILPQLSSGG
jgi:DNA-binding GntR family transcriptional regulator